MDDIEKSLRQQLSINQQNPNTHCNLACHYEDQNRLDLAERGYRFVLAVWPHHLEAASNLGNLLARSGRVAEAEAMWRQILTDHPDDVYGLRGLAYTQVEQAHIEDALENFKRAAELAKHPDAMSEYLGYSLHVGYDEPLHRSWVEKFVTPRPPVPHLLWDGGRPLRVGFIGNVFRQHACAYVLEPLLNCLDKARIEPIIYCDNRPDETTARLKTLAEVRDVGQMDHLKLARQLRMDAIDVAIDLLGHKQGSRLGCLALNPCPIQLGMIGYAGDTFLTTNIDAEVGWAYRPSEAPPVTSLPMDANGFVTFGSLNRAAKITASTASAWAGVIEAVPSSRMLLAVAGGSANAIAKAKLTDAGIPADRLELVAPVATRLEYLARASLIDVHLDTFPYGGGATTFDLLWQGVPSVVMSGDRFSMGSRIMEGVGLSELVAIDKSGYIRATQSLALDRPKLRELRSSMRQRMGRMTDGTDVARRFEALVTRMAIERREQCPKCMRKRDDGRHRVPQN